MVNLELTTHEWYDIVHCLRAKAKRDTSQAKINRTVAGFDATRGPERFRLEGLACVLEYQAKQFDSLADSLIERESDRVMMSRFDKYDKHF